MKILVVEDDPVVAQSLQLLFSNYAYAVDIAGDGEIGLQMAEAYDYDLILLDLFLPKLDGVSLCQQLRAKGFPKPILLLTGQEDSHQKAIALNAGADDYVVKPFDAEELMARVQALLRRGDLASQPILTWGHLSIDPGHRKVSYDHHLLSLTPKEYAILELFLRNPRIVLSLQLMLDQVWNSIECPGEEAVRVHIKELRQKLKTAGAPKDFIKTKHGMGYQLNPHYASLTVRNTEQVTIFEVAELNTVNEELQTALEQLRSTQIELQQRNQELEAARDKLEQRVADRTSELQTLYDQAPCGYHSLDAEGHIIQVNKTELEMFGYSQEEMIGRKITDFFPPEAVQTFEANYPRFMQQGWLKNLALTIVCKDGSLLPISVSATAIKDEEGNFLMSRSIVVDVSERKRLEINRQMAELHQRESEERYRLIFTNHPSPMWFYDPQTLAFLEVNQAAIDHYGYSKDEFLHMTIADIRPPEDVPTLRQVVKRMERGQPHIGVWQHCKQDGTVIDVEVTSYGLTVSGKQTYLALIKDITELKQSEIERKRTELLLQQQRQQEGLLANIAQNIRRSLDLSQVLSSTVHQVRALLSSDRVIIFRFRPDWQGDVMMESVAAGWSSIQGTTIVDPCFVERYIEPYRRGRIAAIANIDTATLEPCYVEFLQSFQIKANLVVPILQNNHLWGLLIVHQCSAPRQWQPDEIALLRQLATQVGIAIQQSELYEQAQRELSAREQMQTVLEESEERFRTLSATAPIGILQINPDGICLYSNLRWQEISGLSFEDSLGNGWLQSIHPGDRDLILAALETYLQNNGGFTREFRLVTAEENIRWISAHISEMRSATGEIISYVCTAEDITERKQVEEALKASEKRLQAILDNSPTVIYLLDLQNKYLLVNRSYAELMSTAPDQLVGKSIYEFWPTEIADRFAANNQTVLETGQRLQLEEVAPHADGSLHTYLTVKFPLHDSTGTTYAICGISTDITDKKQLETHFYRAQRLESLGTLASGIAHDLNNVFTPILAMAQLLRLSSPNLNASTQEMLQVLEDSAKRGAQMIKQILTFTRGTGGERSPIQAISVLQEVIQVIQQSFPKSIGVRATIPDSFPWLISVDPTYVHQVFMNLCINARDAMPNGGTLSFTIEHCFVDQALAKTILHAKVGNYVVITIADTGTGIPPDIRERIFEPFFTTKAQGHGTGLGLATVLGIIKTYDGFLQVLSEVGQGTQIKVYLPTTEAAAALPISQPEHQLGGHGELILAVDDDTAVQLGTQALLENHHYRTCVANTGLEAIERYTQHQTEIKAVVLDIMMPDMDGIALIKRLKAINPDVKIMAMSGLSTNRESALATGATLFLAKPYSLDLFLQNLAHLISN